jgi:demethylmenaquinone methyltransferase/2-methoxy-6-polyprenyl-1,4-benzoquinol methylase
LAILEFGQARSKWWGALFGWYSRVVIPSVGALISGDRSAYEYLPETSAKFPSGELFQGLVQEAGWVPTETKALNGGVAYIYIARKAG